MYLKSIEIHGFKSFANKILFQFHNGITGIVGPNGSGKSNVADAVRWVLGEQSAKQLRGSNMQDVIFSGTQVRKPMGYAYVAITLDNSDHQLATSYEEVTVARRVYRSGESEYLMNGTACRLKDVNELFYDTGIGKEGYSIIGQGQIDKILSGKPEDRRELFDEAAGIVKFKRRKAVAVKKLSDEQGNLLRVNDILGELEKQVGPLARQSEKAKIYLKKREELKRLDINAFLLETERLSKQLEETEGKYSIASSELKDATETYETSKAEYSERQTQLEELEQKIEQKRQEISQTQLKRQRLEGEIAIFKEQIHAAQLSDEHYKERKDSLTRDITAKKKELSEVKSRKAKIDKSAQEAIEERDDAKESQQAVSASIIHLTTSIDKSNQSIIEALNSRNDINTRLSKCDAAIEQINIYRAELNSRILRAKSDESELLEQVSDQEKALKKICDEIRTFEEKIADKELEIGKTSESLRKKEAEHGELEKRYHETNSKLESLRNISERYEGFGGAVRKCMEKKHPGVCGVVSELFKVDKKYETAIETALGGNIQNIVTEDEQVAKDMIRFLRENKFGRATFLPLTSVKFREFNAEAALEEKGVIGLADTLVKVDEKYESVVSHLLHNYIVVDTVDNALKIAKKFNYTLRIVTINGEALNPGGSISGGSFKNNSNLLGRKREMEELSEMVKKLKSDIDDILDEIENIRDKRTALRKTVAELRESQQEKFIQQNTAKLGLDQIKARVAETKTGYDSLRSEESDLVKQLSEIESEKKQIDSELVSSQKTESDTQQKIEEQTRLLEDRRKREADILGKISDLEIKAAQLLQKQEFEQRNVERIEGEIQRLQEELGFIEESLSKTSEEIAAREKDIENIRATIEASKEEDSNSQTLLEQYIGSRAQLAASQKTFLRDSEILSDKKNSLDKEVYRLSGQIEKLKEIYESQHDYMWNEYEITPSQAKEMRDPTLTDLMAMKKEIIAINGAIKELGDVNVNAIEDYRNILERYELMKTQRDDIVEAQEALEKVIAELDEGMRKQFIEKFSEIASQFDKVFKEMFGGGKGTLELLEDEDILEAGIRIIAQPPGKKLQNMMQLSGGEKALTAIALLFAIQNLKPSPFCLLDEIEAALDESNVERFAGYLKKLTKNTQFIVITHRRGTMGKADRLYGITMQEKGVSALVSVDMIDDKDLK